MELLLTAALASELLVGCHSATRGATEAPVRLTQCRSRLQSLEASTPRPPTTQLDQAEIVSLPDRIGGRLRGASGVAWYRCAFQARDQQILQAVYVSRAHANFVVYLNGVWLGQGGRFTTPEAHTWNRPFLFGVDPSQVRGHVNYLDVGLQINGGQFNALGDIWVGSWDTLAPIQRRAFLLRIGVAQASALLSLGACLFFGGFGLVLRDATYALLSFAALCCAGSSLNYFWLEPPMASWTFNTFVNVATHWMISVFALFGMRLIGARLRGLELSVLAYQGLVALAGCVLTGATFERYLMLWYLPPTLLSLGVFALIVIRSRLMSRAERWTSLATCGALVPIAVHDLVLQGSMHAGLGAADHLHLIPYVGPITLIGFGAVLLTRFMGLYRRANDVNLELQRQVECKRVELEEKFARVQELERERAIMTERTRLQREVHDCIGGHLVSMLVMSERGTRVGPEIRANLQQALDDTRLLISSIDPSPQDLGGALADMRARFEPRARSQGLRFKWMVEPIGAANVLAGSQILQLARIVQESITNVLKHAEANTLELGASVCRDGPQAALNLWIRDDGRGMPASKRSGRGLANMRARAEQLGGRLAIESNAAGTRVHVSVPLVHAS